MRAPVAIAAVAALLIGIASAAWGFPGAWSLLAVIPAVILGPTIAHAVAATRKKVKPRPGFVAIGVVLGVVSAGVSMMVFAAAVEPAEQVIEASVVVETPRDVVWHTAGDPLQRSSWNVLVREVEPIGTSAGMTVGAKHRVMLNIDGRGVMVEQTVTAVEPGSSAAWKTHFPEGVRIEDFREWITVAPAEGDTRVTYRIQYRVPTVIGRVFNNFRVKHVFEDAATASVKQLGEVAAH